MAQLARYASPIGTTSCPAQLDPDTYQPVRVGRTSIDFHVLVWVKEVPMRWLPVHVWVTLEADLVEALDRFIEEQHPDLDRRQALALAFRDWATGAGLLELPPADAD